MILQYNIVSASWAEGHGRTILSPIAFAYAEALINGSEQPFVHYLDNLAGSRWQSLSGTQKYLTTSFEQRIPTKCTDAKRAKRAALQLTPDDTTVNLLACSSTCLAKS